MKALVLGAGIVGITTAYELNRDGYDVTVIDREAEPASFTSYSNAGLFAQTRNVYIQFFEGSDRMRSRRLPFCRAETCRHRAIISPFPDKLPEDAFRHRTPAHVSGANKQDCFHSIMHWQFQEGQSRNHLSSD